MFQNVIVPFDGSPAGRVVLAPATDLAWRCGARVVIVNNSSVSDEASRAAIKTRARSQSGADVDFWVDTDVSVSEALLSAATHRPDPIIVVGAQGKTGGILRSKQALPHVTAEVLSGAPCPVMVVGPKADTSRGLAMTEMIVALDGSPNAEQILPLAVSWAQSMRVRLVLTGVVSSSGEGGHRAEQDYLSAHRDAIASAVPEVTIELVVAPDPATGLIDLLTTREDAVVAMSSYGRSPGKHGPVAAVTAKVIANSPRAVVVHRVES